MWSKLVSPEQWVLEHEEGMLTDEDRQDLYDEIADDVWEAVTHG